MQRRLSDPEFLLYPQFIGLIMLVTEAPCRKLTPKPLVFGEQGGVLIQCPESVTPIMAVKVVPQAVPGTRGPWAAQKGHVD